MDIKDRVKSYEPLFNQWLFEELVEIHDQESLIKIKHQAIGVEKTALLKVITLYDQDNNIEFLEKRVEEIHEGKYDDLIEQIMQKPITEMQELYNNREIEK